MGDFLSFCLSLSFFDHHLFREVSLRAYSLFQELSDHFHIITLSHLEAAQYDHRLICSH